MPNFGYDPRDEDMITCEHCRTRYWPDEFHICEEGNEASRRADEAFEKNYMGDGLVRGRITIDFVCRNTEQAIADVVSNATTGMLYGLNREFEGKDEILNFAWKGKIEKEKVKP